MKTSFVTSPDGTGIAYDVVGNGQAIILLHGGGSGYSRQDWHRLGYVRQLKKDFKVITMDFRGHGESDKSIAATDYTIDNMCQDILTVVDACDAEVFAIWGFSYGGNIGRFLAARSKRVAKIGIIGIPLGLAVSGDFRQFVQEFKVQWEPIVQAEMAGTLDRNTLSDDEQDLMQQMNIPVTLAWLVAMLDWGGIEPTDLNCPAMWLAGSENENTIISMKEYEHILEESNVQVQVIDGINHIQELEEVDLMLPILLDFMKS